MCAVPVGLKSSAEPRNDQVRADRGRHSSPARPSNYIVRLAGEKAKLGRVWPHMLRHSCGYYLADRGTDLRTMQDYLGHRDPKHTAHYARVAAHRFDRLWK
jgi:site-specific recombinase XerD